MDVSASKSKLSLSTYIAYGGGDFGPSMAGNTLMVFFFFFLTAIAGLPPSWAGMILLLSNIWSAISTIVVGWLSDRTPRNWGRRRIWMICSAPILGISFFLHWWIPPLDLGWRFVYYLGVDVFFQTAANGFVIPYGALVMDISTDAQEQVRLNGFRFGFCLAGCISSLLTIQLLTYWLSDPQTQLIALGLICGAICVVSISYCCWQTQESHALENSPPETTEKLPWRSILTNYPLLLLVAIYSSAWLAVQITPAILPYFLVDYLHLKTIEITYTVLIMQGTALVALWVWENLSKQLGKKLVYWLGASLWIVADLGLLYVRSDRTYLLHILMAFVGVGVAVAYLIPPSMLPEAVDWSEFKTGQRQEGLFYSILLFTHKITLALGLFLVGQFLSWSGFQEAIPGPIQLVQPDSALIAIRNLTIGLPLVALVGSLVSMYLYPLNEKDHQNIMSRLEKRKLTIVTEYLE